MAGPQTNISSFQDINLASGCKLTFGTSTLDPHRLRWWFVTPQHVPLQIGAIEAQTLITAATAGLLEEG